MAITLKELRDEIAWAEEHGYPDGTEVKVWDTNNEEYVEVNAVVQDDLDGHKLEIHIAQPKWPVGRDSWRG